MPEFAVEFDVYCSCGKGLCFQSEVMKPRRVHVPCVVVEPCEDCVRKAVKDAREEWEEDRKDDDNF